MSLVGARQTILVLLLLPAFLSLASGASQQPSPKNIAKPVIQPGPVHFEDIASQAGLMALNTYGGDVRKEYIIESTGKGAIIFDYDNDGWPDIFLPNGSTIEGFPKDKAPMSHLYHNNHDGTFTDVTAQAGVGRSGWGQGGCVGDYDNDGYLDLLVTFWGRTSFFATMAMERSV